jgi:hypothetical protein
VARALAADPRYPMAVLIGEALDKALSASILDEPIVTP